MRRKTFVSDIPDAWIPQRSGLPSPQSPSIPEAWIPRPPRGMPQHTDPRGAPRGGPVAFGGPTRPRGPRGFGGPGTNIQQVSSSTGIPDAWIPSKIPGFVQFQNQPFSIFRNPLAPKSPVANPVVNPVLTKDSTSTIVQNTPMTLSTLLETIEDPVLTNHSETISMLQNLEQGTYDDVRDIIENPTESSTIDEANENLDSDESEYEEIEIEVTDDDEPTPDT